jgi:site-specific recombinase XerD
LADASGLICGSVERSAPSVRVLDASTECHGGECFFNQLVDPSGVLVSPLRVDSSLSCKDQERESRSGIGLPALDLPTLVSTSDRDGSRNAARVQIAPDSITLQSVGASSSSAIGEIPSVRLEVIRQRLVLRGFSSEVIEMLLASSRRTTVASYQSAWNNWLRWNLARGSDPLSNTLSIVLQYLTELFSSGLASSTINLHRSVLSMTLEPLEGHNIGEHPLVVQLLKGIFNSKPPRPRYDVMWDPDDVIQFFMSAKDNADLSFAVLSYKLVTLIALASLLRVSDLAAISLSSISFSPQAANFSISRWSKNQSKGPLRSFVLPRLTGRSCPVECLESYIDRTTSLRDQSSDSLFLGTKKPYKPVDSSTVARWIKQCLLDAGINQSFSAHSTRGSAASKAAKLGVPADQILKAASWSRENTFKRYYHRVSLVSVANTVLTQTK